MLSWYVFNPYLSSDSYWYLTAAQAIRTNTWQENYVWNRTPGYPAFIAVMSWFSDQYFLEVVGLAQIILVIWSLSQLRVQVLKIQSGVIRINQLRKAINFSYFLSFVLLGGYMTAVLPQAVIAVVLIWQVILYFKLQNENKISVKNAFVFLLVVSISYLVHPILVFSAMTSLLVHLSTKLTNFRTINHKQIYRIGLVSLAGMLLIAGLHVFWSGLAQENASIQVEMRKKQSFQLSSDSPVHSKTRPNPSKSDLYTSDLLEKQQVLKRNALVTDPLFFESVMRPILENPVSAISNFPKLFFINMIGSPNSGPNVSIGFYRMFSGERLCVIAPSAVVLSVAPGLHENLSYRCKSPYKPFTWPIFDLIFKAIYLIAWITGVGMLLRLMLNMLFGGLNGLLVCFIPLAFIGVYTALQANENRYGAPALLLLLMFGSGLPNSKNLNLRIMKRVTQ